MQKLTASNKKRQRDSDGRSYDESDEHRIITSERMGQRPANPWKRKSHGGSKLQAPKVRLEHRDYTVAWVAALPVEMAAAQAMLDNIHEPLPMNQNDTNIYIFGEIGIHNIVIACLPSGQYGIAKAAVVANNMRWSFPSITIRLMVGIGGGVPSKEDIRLGDVVVSNPISNSPGVVQYDFGKTVRKGHFQVTGALNKPPEVLLNAVAKLRADHESQPSRMPTIIAQMNDRYPSMTAYVYQGVEEDRLYDAAYEHPEENYSCLNCDISKVVERPDRPDNYPRVHYGVVASANQVMKHGKTRDLIAQQHGVLCFEMEAAGLMDSFPCLVIRGICDYSDSHKAKKWQPYAASTAAAYAKELLAVVPPQENQKPVPGSNENLKDQDSLQERRKAILASLKFDQIDSRHATIKPAHAKTCQWLAKHQDYARWLDPESIADHHGFLWISGKPGAGKSTIMKFAFALAQKKAARNTSVISFFYNARGEALEKSTKGMHRSLLAQLLEKMPRLQEVLEDYDLRARLDSSLESWDLSLLRDLFARAISRLGSDQVTCFIDALDECAEDEVQQMLYFFEDLGQCAVQNDIKLFVCFSCRHYPQLDIRYRIRFTLEEQSDHEKDLEAYVQNTSTTGTQKQKDELITQILHKASGVFMWVVLVVDILNKEFQRGRIFAVKKRLQEVPPKLSDLFQDILTRDNENMRDLLLSIQWILFGKRPLSREEYYSAMVSGLEPDTLGEWDSEQVTKQDVDNFVVNSSKGLAETTKSSHGTVQFIHESVRDFFLKDDGLKTLWPELGDQPEGTCHEQLKECCYAYIKAHNLPDISSEELYYEKSTESAKTLRASVAIKLPFLKYATTQVLYHSNVAAKMAVPQDHFVRDLAASLGDWIKLNNLFERYQIRRYTPMASLTYILADCNLVFLLETNLRRDPLVETCSEERHGSPVSAAIRKSHLEAAELLLLSLDRNLVKEHIKTKGNRSLLLEAVKKGLAEVVELLLAAGADPNDSEAIEGPLYTAIVQGDEIIVKLLLFRKFSVRKSQKPMDFRAPPPNSFSCGDPDQQQLRLEADCEYRDPSRPSPLHVAVGYGYASIARLILEKGANADRIIAGKAPLHIAAQKADKSCMNILLEKGANPDQCDLYGINVLHQAIFDQDLALARFIIEKGADVNQRKDDVPVLHRAIFSSHQSKALFEVLLQNGANIDVTGLGGVTVLHLAAQSGNAGILEIILGAEPDVNCTDERGQTPVFFACRDHSLNPTAIVTLASKGANIDQPDLYGNTPVFASIEARRPPQLECLVQLGANIDGVNQEGQSALFMGCRSGRLAIVEVLVKGGARLDSTNKAGETALFAIFPYHEEASLLVKLLLEEGLDPTHKNAAGKTFFESLNWFPKLDGKLSESIFRAVAERKVNQTNEAGQTILLEVATLMDRDAVSFLLKVGADPNISDDRGYTPLFAVIESSKSELRELIISILLRNGAETRKPGPNFETPLEMALRLKRSGVASLLGRFQSSSGP